MLLFLPFELIDQVCLLCPRADCVRLLLVSQTTRDIAIRRLYWDIEVDEHNILPFLRTLFTYEKRTLPLDPFLMVRRIRITNRNLLNICAATPLLPIALSRMDNIQTLEMCISNVSADIFYLFLSKTGLVLRDRPCDIPVLRPLDGCDWVKIDGLSNLHRLEVAGNIMFLRLASGRKVDKVVISPMMRLCLKELRKAVRLICGDDLSHNSLHRFTFSLVTNKPMDIVTAISICMDAFPSLQTLGIIIHNQCDPVQASHQPNQRDHNAY